MSKKTTLNNFFNQGKSAKIPSSSNIPNPNNRKHKIYDDPNNNTFSEEVIELNTSDIYISPYKVDREKIDQSKLDALSDNMLNIGQLQPCTVRYNPNPKGSETYELIFGERRYRAAIQKNLKLRVIVKDLDNESSALQLLSENRNREDNTDYQLFKQIHKFISEGILKQKDIVEKTGISKQKISKLMCFEKLSDEISNNISDLNNISSNTVETIYRLSKNPDNISIMLEIIDKIENGTFGHTKIIEYIDKNKHKKESPTNIKILSKSGRHLFTIRKDNNHNNSIHFPKDILTLFDNKIINEEEFYENFRCFIENKLNSLD
ncbi:ParB/RepB/Spo0J family partition protein [Francisella noatunensis]|uniref:ParB/RepB/Spo0J family partition protein n=1 Tax=Francisella noatunensis TaxID=657445 RepID=A0A9Q2QHN3_9GAMM|nr:ParB/RepB/Spo0J family partition protein [Francisella noatunensis]MBK2029264.1 ParB/RepB/Spo0J family partition protein [Francisella noatunensis]MBK2034341.1 ParB/RepB/Spo0J family partition protein [Francisella noatunensis]MBK2049253.1 ParB/RepB/Spo0J family partition protein [Francisella noatunensis]MBK2050172.1 ParB/RepB/Spo0J family partition protein [Francisella noatunensis]MBK2051548.1 ParB/RepB/Spo0J family partition protein [Francisella noatunensis]